MGNMDQYAEQIRERELHLERKIQIVKTQDDSSRVKRIKELDSILKEKMCDAVVVVAEIGGLLKEQKKANPGTFLKWLNDNFQYSQDTAYQYMRVAINFHEIMGNHKFMESPSLQIAYDVAIEIEQNKKEEKIKQIEQLIQIKETTGKNPEGWNVDCDYRLRLKKKEEQDRIEAERRDQEARTQKERREWLEKEHQRRLEQQRIKDEAAKLLEGQGFSLGTPKLETDAQMDKAEDEIKDNILKYLANLPDLNRRMERSNNLILFIRSLRISYEKEFADKKVN